MGPHCLLLYLLPSDRSTQVRQFYVSIQPPVGELMAPVFMSENEFKKEQGECTLGRQGRGSAPSSRAVSSSSQPGGGSLAHQTGGSHHGVSTAVPQGPGHESEAVERAGPSATRPALQLGERHG